MTDQPDQWICPDPENLPDFWVRAPDMQTARDRAETQIMDTEL